MKIATLIIYYFFACMVFSFKMAEDQPHFEENDQQILQILSLHQKSQEKFDEQTSKQQEVDTIYYNGNILTMNDRQPIVQAVSLKNGLIVQTGSNAHVLSHGRWRAKNIKKINLKGKTMMPGFYDSHSHLAAHAISKSLRLSLASPPVGNITSIDQIKHRIRSYIQEKNVPYNQIVYCSFYNELALVQKRHITRLQLDQVSMSHIIVLQHISGHMSVANSLAILLAGVTDSTPDPSGGVIERFKDGPYIGTPTGIFKERAKLLYLDVFSKGLSNDKESSKAMQMGVIDYIEAGVTTAQQGWIGEGSIQLLLQMKEKVKIDVRGYIGCLGTFSEIFDQYAPLETKRFKIQGIKLLLDGSIQGYTGYLSEPYYQQPGHAEKYDNNLQIVPGEEDQYRGFPLFNQTQISQVVQTAVQRQIDVIAHCNGDAAIDIFLEAVRSARAKSIFSKSRLTIIHAQTIREDQLDQVKKLGITPSFFVGHTYYWGDQHRNKFLGPERASRISPTASALRRGINFTLHNDSPVTPMENGTSMIIWSAVNRLTQSNQVLGYQQKISVMQALKSLTIRGAYQGHEQHIKGSIQKGKYADLIILSENPLEVDPIRLKQIRVLQSIKNGISIFQRAN